MDDDLYPSAITDPALILIALGALFGLIAASFWYKVFLAAKSVPEGTASMGRDNLSSAALCTSMGLALACGGFLFGLFTGRF